MKKNSPKKLTLSKDTLRNLEGQNLKEVAGYGVTFLAGCSNRVTCDC